MDINDLEWSKRYADKFFDGIWSNHTLEDIRDPIGVLREAKRIAKRGMFGTPHWTCELTVMDNRDDWEHICGWPHHKWLVGINKSTGAYEFFPKLSWVVADNAYEKSQQNLNIEWDGEDFVFQDIHMAYPGTSKRVDLVRWLDDRWQK